MKKYLRLLSILTIVTIVFGTMYALIQQQNRVQANDIPTMLAQETVNSLADGGSIPEGYFGRMNVLKTSAPFVMIYDKKGVPIAGSGYLAGKIAELPAGVIKHAKPGKNHAVTWAPVKDKRFATVTVASDSYYVVAAQSLTNVESRMGHLTIIWLVGYLLTVALIVGKYVCHTLFGKKMGCTCDMCTVVVNKEVKKAAKKAQKVAAEVIPDEVAAVTVPAELTGVK